MPSGASMLSSWAPEPFGAFVVREGRAPRATGEVALDVATATAAGVRLGDEVAVLTDGRTDLRVVGLVGFADADGLTGSTVTLVTLPEAQRMLGLGDAVSELRVTTDGATADAVIARTRAVLGDEVAVASAQDIAAAGADAAKEQLGSLGIVLTAMSVAAVLVGALLIANTFAIVTSQRRREIALVRAAGATAGQVTRAVLAEAVVLGVLGAAIGTALGVVAAEGLRALTAAFGLDLPAGASVVSARTVLVSLVLGLTVTVVSAVGAARRAARVAPVEALRESVDLATDAPRRRRRTLRRALPGVAGLAGIGAVLAGAPVVVLVPAVVATAVGLALLGPTLTPTLARVVGAPLRLAGLPGELARESAARAPRRTTATATALALALALIAFMTVVGTSLKAGISGSYRETITADLVVESSRAEMLGGLDPQVAERIAAVPEVATASRIRYGHWLDDGRTDALTAVDTDTLPAVADLELRAGSLDGLADGGVVLAESVAEERGLGVGDTVTMTFAAVGDQDLPVVGILDSVDAQALSTSWIVSLSTYDRLYTEDVDASVLVRAADGTTREDAMTAVQDALADHPTVAVRDQAAAADARGAAVDQVLGLVTVLLVLTVVIALLGITNTLALSVAERTREIGLLRAVGTTRRQIAWMVRAEAVLVAALAGVLGLVVGVGLGAVVVSALSRTAPIALALPAGRLAAVVLVAAAAGLVAGLAPARRAARMDVLDAIATA